MDVLDSSRVRALPDAILLDTDDTLYAYEPAHNAAMQAVRSKVVESLAIGPEEFDQAFAAARAAVKQRLVGTASSHSRLLYMQAMLELLGLGSQVLLVLDYEQTYWRTFLNEAVLFDEVEEFLDDLRLLSIPVAIVTDLTAQIQFRKMIYFGLDKHIDFIVTSEETGRDKPATETFTLALEKVRPHGDLVWMIGDDPVADIEGARAAIGAVTFQKLHRGKQLGAGDCVPDVAFREFAELRALLRQLSAGTS